MAGWSVRLEAMTKASLERTYLDAHSMLMMPIMLNI